MKLEPEVILIRHGEVQSSFRSICYGELDVPLSEEGHAASIAMATELAGQIKPMVVFHSGLSRTAALAEAIAVRSSGIAIVEDRRLRERNYGEWQGRSWDQICAANSNFHDLIDKPDVYRPPAGETTTEMQKRVVDWFDSTRNEFANHRRGIVLAISHSGPIAALCGHRLNLPARDWNPWMLKPLEGLRIGPSAEPHASALANFRAIQPVRLA